MEEGIWTKSLFQPLSNLCFVLLYNQDNENKCAVVIQGGGKKRQWSITDAHLLKGIFDDTDGSEVSKPYSQTETLFCVYKHTHIYAYVHYVHI